MKNQALFSSKDKSKKLKCRLLQFLFGSLRVKQSSFLEQQNSFINVLVSTIVAKYPYISRTKYFFFLN